MHPLRGRVRPDSRRRSAEILLAPLPRARLSRTLRTGEESMILTERFLLPPNIDDAQRQAIVRKRMHRHRGGSGRVIAVLPGEDGWVLQAGNGVGTVYFGV